MIGRHLKRLSIRNYRQFKRAASSKITDPERRDFAYLADSDLKHFESLVGKSNVLVEELDAYNVDFMKWYKGKSQCVLTPDSVEQISAILRHCHDRRLAIVPQAGNTGLVGGSVPVHDEIVVSVRKLRHHFKLHPGSGIVECDAGLVLHELDERLEPDHYVMPIDLGARGSCCIGGNIATNAGGIRLIRYGSLNANVLSLQVVIPDEQGTILELGTNLRKDNSDLKTHQLFIGSEGQLGIITRASILVAPKPTSMNLTFLGTDSFENCVQILRIAKRFLGEILSSFELMDSESMRSIKENVQMESVLSTNPAFNLLIESSGSNLAHDSEKMEQFLTHCLENGLANDGVMAKSGTDTAYFWKLRENASLALNLDGYVYKHDLSLPLEHFYRLTEVIRDRLQGSQAKRVVTFGHVGDGNTHLNVTAEQFDQDVYDRLYPFIYEWVQQYGGSISAEHGIGRLKRLYHHKHVTTKQQQINSHIKRAFDPRGVLSPYKMID